MRSAAAPSVRGVRPVGAGHELAQFGDKSLARLELAASARNESADRGSVVAPVDLGLTLRIPRNRTVGSNMLVIETGDLTDDNGPAVLLKRMAKKVAWLLDPAAPRS